MRDFKGMKRQRGRNRGGSSGGNSGKPSQNVNRAFDSNGPDNVKIRGHAQHVYDKYCQLARDAASAGDRVLAENYLQHAEHYFRVLRVLQPTRPASDITGRDVFASGFDIDVDEEADPDAVESQEMVSEGDPNDQNQQRDYQPREAYQRDDRQPREDRPQRDDRPRDDRPREDRQPRDNWREGRDNRDRQNGRDRYEPRNRDDRPRDDRPRDDRPREDRPRDDRPRDDRPRDDRPRDDRPREERAPREDRPRYEGDRQDRPRREDRYRDRDNRNNEPRAERDPLAVVEPQATPLTPLQQTPLQQTPLSAPVQQTPLSAPVQQTPLTPLTPLASAPVADVLRAGGGAVSHAPAFLGASSTAPEGDAEPVKRGRGRPRKVKAEDGADSAE